MIRKGELYSNVWDKEIPNIMSKLKSANKKVEQIKLDSNDFMNSNSICDSNFKTFTLSIKDGSISMPDDEAYAYDLRLALIDNCQFRNFAKDKEIAIRMSYPEFVLSMVYKNAGVRS